MKKVFKIILICFVVLIAIAAACPGMYVGAMLKLFADSRVQGAFVGAAIAVVIAWWFWMVRILLEAIL